MTRRGLTENGDRSSLLRRLDYLPPGVAVGLGICVGTAAGASVLMGTPMIVGGVVFVGMLALAGALAWSGEPIAVLESVGEEPVEEPEQVGEKAVAEPRPVELSVEMVSIPAGRFLMGSPNDEEGRWDQEGPVHEVRVSAFECMRCPVTRRLYAEVIGQDPGWPEGSADERPINNVTWFDAVRFCNQLSDRDGLALCYEVEDDKVSWIPNADGYRLPTEAEWEYACRAGARTRWSCGDGEDRLAEYAWYDANSGNKPQPVGGKAANGWELHDMHGNVFEWCWDWHGPYSEDPQSDPPGLPEGEVRVLRGGSFADAPGDLRSAGRVRVQPELRFRYVGFRCVRVPRRQP